MTTVGRLIVLNRRRDSRGLVMMPWRIVEEVVLAHRFDLGRIGGFPPVPALDQFKPRKICVHFDQVVFVVFECLDGARRNANNHAIVGNIARDDRTRSNDNVGSNRHARQYNRPVANEHIVTDDDGSDIVEIEAKRSIDHVHRPIMTK